MEQTMDKQQAVVSIANKATGGGAIGAGLGWITSELILGICGVVIALLGVGVSWYYKREENKRKTHAHNLMVKWYETHSEQPPKF